MKTRIVTAMLACSVAVAVGAGEKTVGTGQVDFPAVLAAAQKAGVTWYFIEDESPSGSVQIPKSLRFLADLAFSPFAGAASAQTLSGKTLVEALRQGGYVLVMRHASSPHAKPDAANADPANVQGERQLDQTGRDTARAMGKAIKELGIPIGRVLTSPAYRTIETARLANVGDPTVASELATGAGEMQAKVADNRVAWLRKQAARVPKAGSNTLLITHTPNIMASFGQEAAGIASGEALVYHPTGKGPATLVARIKIEDWPHLPH